MDMRRTPRPRRCSTARAQQRQPQPPPARLLGDAHGPQPAEPWPQQRRPEDRGTDDTRGAGVQVGEAGHAPALPHQKDVAAVARAQPLLRPVAPAARKGGRQEAQERALPRRAGMDPCRGPKPPPDCPRPAGARTRPGPAAGRSPRRQSHSRAAQRTVSPRAHRWARPERCAPARRRGGPPPRPRTAGEPRPGAAGRSRCRAGASRAGPRVC